MTKCKDCGCELTNENCVEFLKNTNHTFDLSFLDPPFNQGKEYRVHNDKLDEKEYWDWMREVCSLIYEKTSKGGAIYFMQREKKKKKMQSLFLKCFDLQDGHSKI